jgi:hypothetical protein
LQRGCGNAERISRKFYVEVKVSRKLASVDFFARTFASRQYKSQLDISEKHAQSSASVLDKLVILAIRHSAFVLIAAIAVTLAGIAVAFHLPIGVFPTSQHVRVQIVVKYPALDAEEVEQAITVPIESEMNGIPRIRTRSVSTPKWSVVILTFADVADDNFARQAVLDRLKNVPLPPGASPVVLPLPPDE